MMAEEQTGAAPAAEQALAEGAPAAPLPSPAQAELPLPSSVTETAAAEPPAEPSAPAEPEPPKPAPGGERGPTEGAEAAPAEGAPAEPRPKTLLAEATEAGAEGEAKPTEPAAPEPAKAEEKVEQAHAYEAFTLPEGMQFDQALLGNYTETLGKYGVPQEGGQALLDMHLAEVQRLSDHAQNEQWRVFNETVDRWRTETMADEVLGGAGHNTAMQGVMRAIDRVTGGNEEHRTSLLQALESSGLGSHPAVLRAFYNFDRIMAEPSSLKTTTSEIRPVPDRGGAVRPRSRTGALYPNTNFENGLGR